MTTKINLLPWRNALREQRKKAFVTQLAISGVVGALAVFGGWTYFSQQLSEQQEVNQMITQENAKLDEQLKALEGLDARRAQIEERMKLIEGLQGQRPVIVRIADELVRLIPQEMYVKKFKRQGDKFIIEGRALDPNVVAELLRSLEMSPWFRNAFMSSYIAEDSTLQGMLKAYAQTFNSEQKTSLVERPEVKYGTFIVTVDLEQPKPADKPAENANVALPAGQTTSAPQEVQSQPQPTPAVPAQQGQPVPTQSVPAQPSQVPAQPVPPAQGTPPQQGQVPAQPVPAPQEVPAQPTSPPPAPESTAGVPPAPANNPGVAK